MQSTPQINIHNLSYINCDETSILSGINLSFAQKRTGLVGKNGSGKTTLLKLIACELAPTIGSIQQTGDISYCPQRVHELDQNVSEVLGIAEKLDAIERVAQGSVDPNDFSIIGGDWGVAEKAKQILNEFGLSHFEFYRSLKSLSGGERTRLYLAKTFLSDADFLLLDEPTNNLDASARELLYQKIKTWKKGLVVASHDRQLLQLMDEIVELNTLGASAYGGDYNFYDEQKQIEQDAIAHELDVAKTKMKKAKQSIQKTKENHKKNQKKGRQARRRQDQAKIILDGKCERSEQTQASMLIREKRLLSQASERLSSAREKFEVSHNINIELPKTQVANNKVVLALDHLTFCYSGQKQLLDDVSFQLCGPQRVALKGKNGSGKTTLIKLLLGELLPSHGEIKVGVETVFYIDQPVSALNDDLSVLENLQQYNPMYDDTKSRLCLAQFLFRGDEVLKSVGVLSGGERLLALLACVFMSDKPPQLLILDEPTNHLDLQSLEGLESALKCYQGAMLVVSHDQRFLDNIGADLTINLGLN